MLRCEPPDKFSSFTYDGLWTLLFGGLRPRISLQSESGRCGSEDTVQLNARPAASFYLASCMTEFLPAINKLILPFIAAHFFISSTPKMHAISKSASPSSPELKNGYRPDRQINKMTPADQISIAGKSKLAYTFLACLADGVIKELTRRLTLIPK